MDQNTSNIIASAQKQNVLLVKIMTPRRFLYYGWALSLSSTNSQGRFDILPKHANFITLIENQQVTIRKLDHKALSFNFHQAIIHSVGNEVSVYAEPAS